MTAAKVAALASSVGPVPMAAIITPATAGPMSRPRLKEALLSATALASRSRGTISETKVWRAGLSKAVAMPVISASP